MPPPELGPHCWDLVACLVCPSRSTSGQSYKHHVESAVADKQEVSQYYLLDCDCGLPAFVSMDN